MDNLNPNFNKNEIEENDIMDIIEVIFCNKKEIQIIKNIMALDKEAIRKELPEKTKCLRALARNTGITIRKVPEYFDFDPQTFADLLSGRQLNPSWGIIWECAFVLNENYVTAVYLLWLWGCLEPRTNAYEIRLHQLLKEICNGKYDKKSIIGLVNDKLEEESYPRLWNRKERKDRK